VVDRAGRDHIWRTEFESVLGQTGDIVAALSAEFEDRLTTPQIEDCVRSLEEEIRSAHPEVSLLFVKPQTAATWESRRRAIDAGGTDSD